MSLQRMDNVLIVVEDLEAARTFFADLGMELEGEATVEGSSVDRLIGLDGVRATIASMRTPDGHGRIELDKFHAPPAIRLEPVDAPVNALGIRRIMFEVDDLDAIVARVLAGGAELIGEVVQYKDTYRLAYIRGPEGIVVGLSEQLIARGGEG
jgi:catechol 2,3-dioxygenase-like lactoylglutathione lyase family enzyme